MMEVNQVRGLGSEKYVKVSLDFGNEKVVFTG